jgi:hypothetical protein
MRSLRRLGPSRPATLVELSPGRGLPPYALQVPVAGMAAVALEVQGQVERPDKGISQAPWPLVSLRANKGVFGQLLRESYFAIGERQSLPAPRATQVEVQLLGKQAADREASCCPQPNAPSALARSASSQSVAGQQTGSRRP